MPCVLVKMPCGGTAIVRVQRSAAKKCSVCGQHQATYQCDFPMPTKHNAAATCDAWLCAKCLVPVGTDRDYCPTHPLPLFGGDAA